MSAERQSGSDSGGRPLLDWEQAFAFYAQLPAPERSYRAVAEEFSVSVRTVERHGREQGWKVRLGEVQAEAARQLNAELGGKLLRSLKDSLRLIEATRACYAQQLRAGTVKVTPADLQRMAALEEQLGERIAELQAAEAAREHEAAAADPRGASEREAYELEVLRGLHESGALDRLRARLETPASESEREEPK